MLEQRCIPSTDFSDLFTLPEPDRVFHMFHTSQSAAPPAHVSPLGNGHNGIHIHENEQDFQKQVYEAQHLWSPLNQLRRVQTHQSLPHRQSPSQRQLRHHI